LKTLKIQIYAFFNKGERKEKEKEKKVTERNVANSKREKTVLGVGEILYQASKRNKTRAKITRTLRQPIKQRPIHPKLG